MVVCTTFGMVTGPVLAVSGFWTLVMGEATGTSREVGMLVEGRVPGLVSVGSSFLMASGLSFSFLTVAAERERERERVEPHFYQNKEDKVSDSKWIILSPFLGLFFFLQKLERYEKERERLVTSNVCVTLSIQGMLL